MKRKTAQQMRDAMVRHVRETRDEKRKAADRAKAWDDLVSRTWDFAPSVATATFAEYYDSAMARITTDGKGNAYVDVRKKPIVHEPTWLGKQMVNLHSAAFRLYEWRKS